MVQGMTTIASGGTLTPGNNGVGTLHINGALGLTAGSTTAIDVGPAGADQIELETVTVGPVQGIKVFDAAPVPVIDRAHQFDQRMGL